MTESNARVGTKSYFSLAVIATLIAYLAGQMLMLVHELAHGLTALSLGGYFPFVQLDADGGRSIYVLPDGSSIWKESMVLLAGPSANLIVSLLALGLVAVGIRRKSLRLLTVFVGGLSILMLMTGTGLVPPWWNRYKETGEALFQLGASPSFQLIIKCFWLLAGVVIFAVFFRLFFRELAQYFPSNSYRERFFLVTAGLGVPIIMLITVQSIVMLSAGYGEGVITLKRHSPHVAFLVLTYFLLPLLLKRSSPDHRPDYFTIPRLQFVGSIAAVVLFATVQPVVFGNNRISPSGLFLSSRPPEVTVAACNVRASIGNDRIVHVELLMRAYPKEHEFLWSRVSDLEPEDWRYYDEAAGKLLPAIFDVPEIKIVGHRADRKASFFNGVWGEGARVVAAEFPFSQLPRLPGDKRLQVLKLVDPWRAKGVGFIDHVAVNLDEGLSVGGVGSQPVDAAPTRRSAARVEWENNSLNSGPVTMFIGISDSAQR